MTTHEILHYLRNPYGHPEETIRQARLEAANKIEQMEALLKTPIAWRYHIVAYCDHAPSSGVVMTKNELKNIPAEFVSWEPVLLGD